MDLAYQIVFNRNSIGNPLEPESFLCLFGMGENRKFFLPDHVGAITGFLNSEWAYLLLEGRGIAVLEDVNATYKFIDANYGFVDAFDNEYGEGIIFPHPFERTDEHFQWVDIFNQQLYDRLPILHEYNERFEVFDVLLYQGKERIWCHAMSSPALIDNYDLREAIEQEVAFLVEEQGLDAPPLIFFNSFCIDEITNDSVIARKFKFLDGEIELDSGGYLSGPILGHYNPV
jgi:hypothetical protein